jgi:hypothetical protein
MRALVVVFGLICGECLGARGVATCVRTVAGMAEQVTGEFGTLFEVFGAGIAGFPLAEARSAVVYVSGFGVFVEGFWGWESGET